MFSLIILFSRGADPYSTSHSPFGSKTFALLLLLTLLGMLHIHKQPLLQWLKGPVKEEGRDYLIFTILLNTHGMYVLSLVFVYTLLPASDRTGGGLQVVYTVPRKAKNSWRKAR